jgi:hypothetical protein
MDECHYARMLLHADTRDLEPALATVTPGLKTDRSLPFLKWQPGISSCCKHRLYGFSMLISRAALHRQEPTAWLASNQPWISRVSTHSRQHTANVHPECSMCTPAYMHCMDCSLHIAATKTTAPSCRSTPAPLARATEAMLCKSKDTQHLHA